jgi:hypothetical protein
MKDSAGGRTGPVTGYHDTARPVSVLAILNYQG